jgi:hypothetical protein
MSTNDATPAADRGSECNDLLGAGPEARRIRVYRMDDMEWWVGESLAACVAEGKSQCGPDCYDEPSLQYELDDEQLQKMMFIDESDGAEPPVKRTFAEQLAREIAEGGPFPRPFAAEDW